MWRGLSVTKERIKSYGAVMSDSVESSRKAQHSDTWRQTLNSDLVRSGEGGANLRGKVVHRQCSDTRVLARAGARTDVSP